MFSDRMSDNGPLHHELPGAYKHARVHTHTRTHAYMHACTQVLWKAYIDFEIGEEEYDHTRELYERLMERTKHVKV